MHRWRRVGVEEQKRHLRVGQAALFISKYLVVT